jgi:hypothetical protein
MFADGWGGRGRLRDQDLGLIGVQASMTLAAKSIVGPELYELTAVTSHNLPCVNGSESSSHAVLGDARAGINTCTCNDASLRDCRVRTSDVKRFLVETLRNVGKNPEETQHTRINREKDVHGP